MTEKVKFTDQKPHKATEEDIKLPWGGARNGERFRCYLCGHKFEVGDTYRWVYCDEKWPNFFTCNNCDGDDVLERFKKHAEDGIKKYWWMRGE